MRKLQLLLLILFTIAIKLNAQTIPTEGVEITKAIPASPDAAALGKYGSVPVSPYTGIPNISIPLYNIKSGSINLPVSLSYHAGGNRIEEAASSVGLGWALNAGGVITRTIRGFADESSLGFLDPGQYVSGILATVNSGNSVSANQATYLNQIADGTMDGEADMYNFNFGDYSGRFVMDSYGNIMVIPQQKIKFTFVINSAATSGPMIQSFTAVTPDGTIYVFGSDADGNDAVEQTYAVNGCSNAENKKYYATSWYIKQIKDPTGHTVNFNYVAENYQINQAPTQSSFQFQGISTTQSSDGSNPVTYIPNTSCNTSSLIYGVKLNSIVFENGTLQLHTSPRKDLDNSTLIDSVLIKNSNGFSKKYCLYYTNSNTTRLRLDSMKGFLNPITPNKYSTEKYSFVYNADTWTPSTVFNQDYWGFNNGHTENSTLIPAAYFTPPGTSSQILLSGANRSADEQAMQGGMLTQINYPTGGYTTFAYEANQEFNEDLGGTSINYPPPPPVTIAKCNDPNNGEYYNYDILHNNPNDLIKVVSPSGVSIPVGVTGSGFLTNTSDTNDDYISSSLESVDSLGNALGHNEFPINNIDTSYMVPPGWYRLRVIDPKNKGYSASNPDGAKYLAVVSYQNAGGNAKLYQNYVVGGLRIRQIADYDGVNDKPFNMKTFQYTSPGKTTSSGFLDYLPTYSYTLGQGAGEFPTDYYVVYYFVRTTISNYPLSSTHGSVVGYSHVTELTSTNGQNGKTEYYYTNSQTDPDLPSGVELGSAVTPTIGGFPFSPVSSHDWRRGLLLRQTTWRYTGNGTFAKVQDKVNSYGSKFLGFNNNIKAGFNPKPEASLYSEGLAYFNDPQAQIEGLINVFNYTDYTDFTYLASTTTTDYSLVDSTKFSQTTTNFSYDSLSYGLSKLVTTNSKNEIITQTATYPLNYNSGFTNYGSALQGLTYLQNNHIWNVPIEEVTQKQNADGSNLRTTKAVLTTYKPTQPLRDTVFEMRHIGPLIGFVNSSSAANGLTKDSHYQPVVAFNNYDLYGNITQENKVGDALHSYIWGYQNPNPPSNFTEPIAEVINAGQSDIAYTNFESYTANGTGYGNWTYSNIGTTADATAPMGAGCYSISGNSISKSGLNSTLSYTISFWAKAGSAISVTGGTTTALPVGNTLNGWNYYEYKVTAAASVNIGGNGYIDELRLYPSGALMKTYAYVALVGIAAVCDAKNQFVYYQYDNVGRLITIKDQYGNITKALTYHYQGQ